MRLTDFSITSKFAVILTIITTAGLLLMAFAFGAYDHTSLQRDAIEHLATLGNIVADNSTAAVAFNDERSAGEVLDTLRQEPDILDGCTYDKFQHVLAQYHKRSGKACPEVVAPKTTVTISSDGAIYIQPIILHDAPAGYIYLSSSLALVKARQDRFNAITAVFLLVSFGVAGVVGAALQRWITRPIVQLASVMQEVSESSDYSRRVEPGAADEIGQLVSGFNLMLAEIQSSQSRLEHQALNDELTGLPNRRLFADRLEHALEIARRKKYILALIYLDLDSFKLVNDTLGHPVGDVLLREVADRLRRRVRASDTLARIGGDEFTVIAGDLHTAVQAELIATAILAEFVDPFSICGHDLSLTASLGISFFPENAIDGEQLIRQADTAMYVAKGTGKNKFVLFTSKFGEAVQEHLELTNQLRGAIERGEFVVHYQPKLEAVTSRLLRFEALIRWVHPTLGTIPASTFIPIAEEAGLIVLIGRWVLEQACKEAFKWQTMSHLPVQVAVNVSPVQLLRSDFVALVADVLERTGLEPGLLHLELTESVLMPGFSESSNAIPQLRTLGVSMGN